MKLVNEDRLLNRLEVEQQFGVSKRFLELAASSGQGPKLVRIGRLVKYRPRDVRDWIEENASSGAA